MLSTAQIGGRVWASADDPFTARRWAPAPWLDDDLQQITVAYLRLPAWPRAAFGAVPRALDAALGAVPRALHASPAFVACALDAAPHAVACWSPESQSRRSEGRGAVLGPQLQTPLVPRTPNLVRRVPEWKIFDATEFLVHPFPSCLAPFWHKNKQPVSGSCKRGHFENEGQATLPRKSTSKQHEAHC